MLYPLHLLVGSADSGWRLLPVPGRAWRPTVLVPRQLCVFESLPCAELRLYELAGFARLQATRLSPFGRSGASAIRRSGRLLIWIWDAEEVEAAVRLAGADPESWTFQAEPLFLELPAQDGQVELRCTQTFDRLQVEGSALILSEPMGPQTLDATVLRRRSLAHDWMAGGAKRTVGPSRDYPRMFNAALMLMAFAYLCVVAFRWGDLLAERRRADETSVRLEQLTQQRQAERQLDQRTAESLAWVNRYRTAAAELDLAKLLDALRPVLESNGVVIRDLDATHQAVRLVLTTVGGDIRLPDLITGLIAVPGLRDVQLLQHSELSAATVSFLPAGYSVDASRSNAQLPGVRE